jgi:flavodoxin I
VDQVPNIILVYASMSGNTEEMAQAVAQGARDAGASVDIRECMSVSADELPNFDGVLLGSYSWGDGELPDELLDFGDDLDELDLTGKKAAVFGSGDSSYDEFCGAVDILYEKLTNIGAEVVLDRVKVDGSPTDKEIQMCKEFGASFAKLL